MTSSRLDRLFVLLETGSSAVTRSAAAKQLGEVQRLHPHELRTLLTRTANYLKSTNWETRIAASEAVRAIISNVPQWEPEGIDEEFCKKQGTPIPRLDDEFCRKQEEEEDEEDEDQNYLSRTNASTVGRLRFDQFNMSKVLANSTHLMASEGKEFELDEEQKIMSSSSASGTDLKDLMAKQRQILNARLGFDVSNNLGIMDSSSLFSNEDLMMGVVGGSEKEETKEGDRKPLRDLISSVCCKQQGGGGGGLSSREMNRAKRKARQAAVGKQRSRDQATEESSSTSSTNGGGGDVNNEPEMKRLKLEQGFSGSGGSSCTNNTGISSAGGFNFKEGVRKENGSASCGDAPENGCEPPSSQVDWPLEWFCDALSQDLFSSSWEIRHGAATALREIITIHGKGAGKCTYLSAKQMEKCHQIWLEDIAIRLLCVLALDRFGDFVSDAVVAPVRETCAQSLCAVLKLMDERGCRAALKILLQLLSHSEWETRHGGLLGLKYLLAVREDMVDVMLPESLPYILKGLSDHVDDVGAVAASALIPVTSKLIRLVPESIPVIVNKLWELLAEQDELAAACNSFMGLLAAILNIPEGQRLLPPQPLNEVVPRLWPFLSHSASSVRKATLQTLGTLTECRPLLLSSLPDGSTFASPNPDNINISSKPASCDMNSTPTTSSSSSSSVGSYNVRWEAQLLQDAMRHVYQRVLVEPNRDVRAVGEKVWRQLLGNSGLTELLHAACPFITVWLYLCMQPARVPFDPNFLIQAKTQRKKNATQECGSGPNHFQQQLHSFDHMVAPPKYYVAGSETTPLAQRELNAVQVRCMAARMLGLLSIYIVRPAPGIDYTAQTEKPIDCYVKVLMVHLNSKSALQRMMAGLVIAEWARLTYENNSEVGSTANDKCCPELLKERLHSCLNERVYFDEIALSFTKLTQETRDFLATLKHYKVPITTDSSDNNGASNNVFTLEKIQELTGPQTRETLLKCKQLKNKVLESLEERRRSIQTSVVQTSNDQLVLSVSTLAALAGAAVMFRALPEKLTPVAKPLMESIRREQDEHLQKLTATHLAHLLDQCRERTPHCPNDKIITNLCTFLRSDPEFTPVVYKQQHAMMDHHLGGTNSSAEKEHPVGASTTSGPQWTQTSNFNGIVTLNNQQKNAERAAFKRQNSAGGRGPGRPPATDIPLEELFREEDEAQKANRVQRRGASMALTEIVRYFGENLPRKVPKLWEMMVGQLEATIDPDSFVPEAWFNSDDESERLVWILQVLEVATPNVHPTLMPTLMSKTLRRLCVLLSHPYRAVRHLSSRCLAGFAKIDSVPVMDLVVNIVLPKLDAIDSEIDRQGAVEAVACIIDALQFDIIPYVVLLVVPLLGRMSDQNMCVRLMGTHSFATLVQLMPLDGGVPEPPTLKHNANLTQKRDKEREFLRQLLSPATIPDYVVPVPISAELRSYQQAGVNWLAFLNKYKLHGILCDDMGLGKTIQSICMLAGDHYERDRRYKEMMSMSEKGGRTSSDPSVSAHAPLPSLVICPPTLTGHWVYEVEKFLSHKYLKPLQYNGTPTEREKLRHKFKRYNLIVASYDIVRKDIAVFSNIKWNYVVLDEGHVIKNGKTRTSMAIKSLQANHRLILSGTPIQNNVLELWSLFDFLMPGFLGTEKQFTARYSRPILASRDPKSLPKDQEAGALAMEALHRQVLPFLLRRVKEDVLDDLPPKITQDYYCELSPLQERLYEDFSKSQAHQTLQESIICSSSAAAAAAGGSISGGDNLGALSSTTAVGNTVTASQMQGNTHIFQALRYLQNVCNHPKLVLNSAHPQYAQILADLRKSDSRLDDIGHSAKLPALKQLLQDCGIGVTSGSESTSQQTELVVSQHRALVFCQLKAMLDIIEKDLLKKHMPDVTYLRLDGSVPPTQRHSVVTRFNNDPSIDVLLLTTQVGGLGLNLTGADTVIFVEHDWNPMKDLQAMDRAHRIGQKKVVNVYRLITRGTLEEKIMGLQKFKVQTVNTIISTNNSKLETMGTDQLLDLFSHKKSSSAMKNNDASGTASVVVGNSSNATSASTSSSQPGTSGGGGVKTILDQLPDLWDQKQYDDEYDLTQFMARLQ